MRTRVGGLDLGEFGFEFNPTVDQLPELGAVLQFVSNPLLELDGR